MAVVEKLKPHRIGHGIRAAYDESAMKLLRERDVVLELCPTSNLHTRAVEGLDELKHIMRTFWDRGREVHASTPTAPTCWRRTCCREVELVEKNGLLTPEQVDQTLAWARQYSFIPA